VRAIAGSDRSYQGRSDAVVAVQAQGVAILKDNINQMIANLRETTRKKRARLVEN